MAEGVDYSFAQPSPAGLYAAGKRFAGRYVGPGSGKLLTAGERDALFAAGLDIFLLAEGNADSALGGYNAGVQHGEQAKAAAEALGAPWNTAVYFAVDFDVTAAQWSVVAQYLRGAAFGVGTPQVGIYGGLRAIQWAARDGVADWFFQTYAWSGGQWYPGNHVEQYLNGVTVAGGEVDLCRSMQANYGQWSANGSQEDDMSYEDAQNGASLTAVGSSAFGYPKPPKAEADAIGTYNLKAVEARLNKRMDDLVALIKAIPGGGSGGPVDLTDAAVEKVADAVVDEEHARLAQ